MKRISEKKLQWLLQQKLDMSNVVPKLNKLLANNSILVRFGMAGMAQNEQKCLTFISITQLRAEKQV